MMRTKDGTLHEAETACSRDDNWNNEGQNDAIRDNWSSIIAGWSWKANAQANGDLTNLVNSEIGGLGLVLGVIGIVVAA
jgi:hypothetical protein